MKKILFIILIIVLFNIIGCAQNQNFDVEYYAEYSSSGGDRILNITYYVREGVIVNCKGTYSFPPSSEQQSSGIFENNVEKCNLLKLIKKEYNAPTALITSFQKNQKNSDEIIDGDSRYRYKIVFDYDKKI